MTNLFKFKWILIVLILFSMNLLSAEKRAFTIDDLYSLKGINDLEISPDGKKLLFSVTGYNLEKGTSSNDIYLMDLVDGNQKQLTFDQKSDYKPSWSVDGRKIYFLSNREEGDQLWEMDADGGEARRVSDFFTGISSPLLSASGKIFFTSTVFTECMEDCQCNKKYSEKLEGGNVQAHMADSLLYRHWNSYRDWQYTHLFCLDTNKEEVKAITSGRVDYPCFSLGGKGFDISPDSNTICIVSNHDKDLAYSTNSDLFLIDLKSPEPKPVNITKENKAFDGSPAFSPDGRWIAYLTQKVPRYESDRIRLAIYNIESKQTKILTEFIDNWVDDFKWSADSRYIYFLVQKKGDTPMYRVNLTNNKVEKILERLDIRKFQITPDGKSVIFKRSSVGEPYEIWRFRFGNKGSLRRLIFLVL